jgi:HD-like signal output (HDOD) protein/ActR/RegA family two-component response regulator
MTRPQILFVDDEPSVLSALRRMLWKRHDDWDLHWATTSDEALGHLHDQHIDILVTDMRMPGTDGAALLEQARLHHPGTARLVLSGHADHDSIIAAAGPTQQFLSKPCDPAALENALDAAVATLRLMDDPRLRSLLGSQERLPKPPRIYTELTALTTRPQTTIADIARLIERDVATTAEVLKLVNSSFFGLASNVTSIERAVTLLGLDVIQALVLAGHVFTPGASLPAGLDASDLADRGLRACLAVRRIGQTEGWNATLIGQLGLAALLHDVGLLILAAADPPGWATYQTADPTTPTRTRQTQAFGCTIGHASAYLLGLWGFTQTIVTTLADQPLDLDDPAARAAASPATLALAIGVAYQNASADLTQTHHDEYLHPQRLTCWQDAAQLGVSSA